jgi:hypothetical protein
MTEPGTGALAVIERQLKELEAILQQAERDLNTVAGGERLAKWKARTIPLIAQGVGQKEAQRFADTRPGPSFTSDLLEELSDEVELYRTFLRGLAERVEQGG